MTALLELSKKKLRWLVMRNFQLIWQEETTPPLLLLAYLPFKRTHLLWYATFYCEDCTMQLTYDNWHTHTDTHAHPKTEESHAQISKKKAESEIALLFSNNNNKKESAYTHACTTKS